MFMVISSDIYNTHINWDIMVKRKYRKHYLYGSMAKEFRIIMNEKPDWDKICSII